MKFSKKVEITIEITIIIVFTVAMLIFIPEIVRYNRYLRYSRICDAVADYARRNNTLPVNLKSLCEWKNSESDQMKWDADKLQRYVKFEWASDSFPKVCSSNFCEIVFISIRDKNMKHQEKYFNDRLRGLVKKDIFKKELEKK